MAKRHWADVEIYGRMLASIVQAENTKYKKACADNNEPMAETHLNRVNITFKNLKSLMDQYSGVDRLLKEGNKIATAYLER